MATQFHLAYVKHTADGKHVTAVIVDRDWTRFTSHPKVQELDSTDEGPLVRFPKHMLARPDLLDLER